MNAQDWLFAVEGDILPAAADTAGERRKRCQPEEFRGLRFPVFRACPGLVPFETRPSCGGAANSFLPKSLTTTVFGFFFFFCSFFSSFLLCYSEEVGKAARFRRFRKAPHAKEGPVTRCF